MAMATKISPCLLYTKNAAQAARYYASIFKDSKIYSSDSIATSFRIGGLDFLALNGPASKFTWNVSFMIDCKNQKEVDYYWNRLKIGGKELPCGWLQDKYGMAWQVVPSAMMKFLGAKDRTKANRAIEAMMKMKKLDISVLKAAFDGK
jgi:predicted 3-demethylubiquinone-9 3-methyltransferase (glyoxalase superfamily)